MKKAYVGYLGGVIVSTIITLQYIAIYSYTNTPVSIFSLNNEMRYEIWKEISRDDYMPVVGLRYIMMNQGYKGIVYNASFEAVWRFDLESDYPPQKIHVVEVDGRLIVVNRVTGTRIGDFHSRERK